MKEGVPQHQPVPQPCQPAIMLSHTRHSPKRSQQPTSMLPCSPALSPIMGRCLSPQNAQTVTPGRHCTELLVAPWLARLQLHDCCQDPRMQMMLAVQQVPPPAQPTPMPSTCQMECNGLKSSQQPTSRLPSSHALSPSHHGKMFVLTKCSDSDTGPPPH